MSKCKICGKEFKNGLSLGGHMAGAHQTESQKEKMKAILTKDRIEVKSFCKKCGKEFKYLLTKNKDGTINHKKHERVYCSRVCANGHPKKWICKICNKEFLTKRTFKNHYHNHVVNDETPISHQLTILQKMELGNKFLENKKIEILNKIKQGKIKTSSRNLKIKLIKYGIRKDECEKCGWSYKNENAKFSNCELHHINGKSDDCSLDNLQILCPNCHSATNNYKGKNRNSDRINRKKYYAPVAQR